MSKIFNNRIFDTNPISTPSGRAQTVNQNYTFSDKFNFSEMELKKNVNESNEESETLKRLIYLVLSDVLVSNCDIISRGSLVNKDISIEASFLPSSSNSTSHKMYLPLIGSVKSIKAVNLYLSNIRNLELNSLKKIIATIVDNSANKDLLKLIILASHEFGHLRSYQTGFHDKELKLGLSLLHSNNIGIGYDKYTYQVFNEEITAWRFARQMLERYKFNYWNIFDSSMYNSLKAYYKILNLEHASVATYCKLSMLDINLQVLR